MENLLSWPREDIKTALLMEAYELLEEARAKTRAGIIEAINAAQTLSAQALNTAILPVPEWEVHCRGYGGSEARNILLRILGTIQLRIWYCACDDPKDIERLETFLSDREASFRYSKKEILTVISRKKERFRKNEESLIAEFISGFYEWEEKRFLSPGEIIRRKNAAIEKYNRTFRENAFQINPNQLFFAEDLKKEIW